jgi:NADPH:quinone reductase
MNYSIRIHAHGGPEVLQYEEVEIGEPGPSEVRVRHCAIGVNYIDTKHRAGQFGQYRVKLPSGIGLEAAGVVEAVGSDVETVKPGDRVAYAGGSSPTDQLGAYSEKRVMRADRLVKIPDDVSDETAATLLLKGLTVQCLFRQVHELKSGDTILFHAAAGGVGLIACQWARTLGVRMIGTAGSDEKAALAKEFGCADVIVYSRENFVDRVKELTGGRGVDVVYDSIGKDTFPSSLECLRPRGLFVTFGSSSGPIPLFDSNILAQKGSLFFTRPGITTYAAKREDLTAMADEVFGLVLGGKIICNPRQSYALKDAKDAHRAIESRTTTGSSILIPS